MYRIPGLDNLVCRRLNSWFYDMVDRFQEIICWKKSMAKAIIYIRIYMEAKICREMPTDCNITNGGFFPKQQRYGVLFAQWCPNLVPPILSCCVLEMWLERPKKYQFPEAVPMVNCHPLCNASFWKGLSKILCPVTNEIRNELLRWNIFFHAARAVFC